MNDLPIIDTNEEENAVLVRLKNDLFDTVLLVYNIDEENEEEVAETEEEAADFLDECMAVVVNSVKEVWEYFDEAGLDVEEYDEKSYVRIP